MTQQKTSAILEADVARAAKQMQLFQRGVSGALFALGVMAWLHILGVMGAKPFEDMPLTQQVIVGYFAVIWLLASVGLWLQAAWGAVIWLIALLADVSLWLGFPEFALWNSAFLVAHLLAMMIYGVLFWRLYRVQRLAQE